MLTWARAGVVAALLVGLAPLLTWATPSVQPAAAGAAEAGVESGEEVAAEPVEEAGAARPPSSPEAIRARVERLYDNPRYQSRYPGEGEPEKERPTPWSPGPLAGLVLQILVYAAAAAGVILLIYLVAQLLRGPKAPKPAEAPAPVRLPPVEAPVPPAALPDPEALAADGRFGEAVHALLLHTVPLLAAWRGTPWPAGTTGREMAAALAPGGPRRAGGPGGTGGSGYADRPAAAPLDAAPRRAFSLLVSAVEHFLFARRPLTEEDWLVCRGAFEDLRSALGSRPSTRPAGPAGPLPEGT